MPKNTIISKEMSLRNLASDITREIKNEIKEQDILSIPLKTFRDENYAASGGLDAINDINERVEDLMESSKRDGITHKLSFGMWSRENDSDSACEDISLRVGESPVINPPWQFNELDDVRSNPSYPHMGRVYLTYIYANFPILTFKPGREKLNANILSFFTKGLGADHKVLNNYIRSGGDNSIENKIALGLVSIKNVTLGAIEGVLGLFGANFGDVSKFITFKDAMPLYRNMANNLLREFAANLGLLDLTKENFIEGLNFDLVKGSTSDEIKTEIKKDKELKEVFKNIPENEKNEIFGDGASIEQSEDGTHSNFGDSRVLQSITSSLREAKLNLASSYRGSFPRLDVIDMIPHSTFNNGKGLSPHFASIESMSYLPYLCQSNISISETFSNSTKEHPIAGEINSMSEDSANKKGFGSSMTMVSGMKDTLMNGGAKSVDEIINKVVTEVGAKVGKEILSNGSELGAIMNGDGRMAIPEVWAGSSYSRSYSIDFKFWSPTGDTVSIFENVYIPYLLLMVLSAPLQTGYSSYMSPFIIKVFSKGLFSIDMGIIESMSVTRGDGANDRTKFNFPRSIKVSVTVKDLSPVMMLSLGNGAFWKYKRANGGLSEYIATMCNLSIADRYDMARKFDNYVALIRDSMKTNFSLHNIGYNFNNSLLMKPFVAWNRNKVTVDHVKTDNIYI